jgi:hypothetical protein
MRVLIRWKNTPVRSDHLPLTVSPVEDLGPTVLSPLFPSLVRELFRAAEC